MFGRDRVNGEIGRIRSVLAGWGYRLGRDDDQLLPMVACQMLLLNRSPHLEALSTEAVRAGCAASACCPLRRATPHAARDATGRRGPGVLRTAAALGGNPRPRRRRPAARRSGPGGPTAGTARPRSLPRSAAVGPRHPAQGRAVAERPSVPRPPTPPAGRGRPARPGSRHWTGWQVGDYAQQRWPG